MNLCSWSKSCCRWIYHIVITSSYVFIIHWCMVDLIMGDGGPSFIKAPSNHTTFVDRNLSIYCEVTGEPQPIVTWQQINLTTGRWEDLPKFGTQYRFRFHANPLPTLYFDRMLRSDSGFYRCVAHNRKGTLFSDPFYINVEAKVTFVKGPRSRTVLWGTEVVLQCEVISFPLPHRTWTKNNIPIRDPVSEMIYSQPTLKVNATETASYSCLADNSHSEGHSNVSATAVITVNDHQCQTYTGKVCRQMRAQSSVYVPVFIPQPLQYIESSILALLRLLESSGTSLPPSTPLNTSSILDITAPQWPQQEAESSGDSTGSGRCREMAAQLLCAAWLPDCPKSSGPSSKKICRENCMAVRDLFCMDQWLKLVSNQDNSASESEALYHKSASESEVLYHTLPDCESLPLDDGHSQCIDFFVVTDKLITTTCYEGDGRYYRGPVNSTVSGYQCQSWDSQTPNVHQRYPSVYRGLRGGAGNQCRNIGGERDRPWCFVVDEVVRWEYCDIPKCGNESNATASGQADPNELVAVKESLFDTGIIFVIVLVLAVSVTVLIIVTTFCIRFMIIKSGNNCQCSRQYGVETSAEESAAAAVSLVKRDDDISIDVRLLPSNRSYRQSRDRRESGTTSSQRSIRASGSHEEETNTVTLDHLEFQRNEIEWIQDIAPGMYGRVFLASIPNHTVAHSLSPRPLGRVSLGGVGAVPRCGGKVSGAAPSLAPGSVQMKASTLFGGFGGGIATRTKTVVKMLEEDEEVMERFKSELEIVASLSHDNIIQLLGVCLRGTPLCALYEYMDDGDLSGYLLARRPGHFIPRHRQNDPASNSGLLLGIGKQISAAMVYLSSQHIVHRDLATRNCLVSRESKCTISLSDSQSANPVLGPHAPVVKLSDFGLATRLTPSFKDKQRVSVPSVDVDYVEGYEGEPIPVRWLSPESIAANRYSTASDVWSYGVTLWEVFSYAAQPYPEIGSDCSPEEVAAAILNGYIMGRPDAASVEVYDVMSLCWSYDPLCRPTFDEIYRTLCYMEEVELNRCCRS